jgi:hypothetical protein
MIALLKTTLFVAVSKGSLSLAELSFIYQPHLSSSCHHCQLPQKDDRLPPALLSSLHQPTEPNQSIHADLFGPLKTSESGKKFILCMTDAHTKYVELVSLPNKEANPCH